MANQSTVLQDFIGEILVPIRKDFFNVGDTRLNIDSMFVIIKITKTHVIFPEHVIPKEVLAQFLPTSNCLQQSLQKFILNDAKLTHSCVINRVGYNRVVE